LVIKYGFLVKDRHIQILIENYGMQQLLFKTILILAQICSYSTSAGIISFAKNS